MKLNISSNKKFSFKSGSAWKGEESAGSATLKEGWSAALSTLDA